MSGRVLTQIAVSFLLGVLVSRYGNVWGYAVWLIWLLCVGRMGFRQCRRQEKRLGCQRKTADKRCWHSYLPVVFRISVCLAFCLLGQLRWQRQQSLIRWSEAYLADAREITVVGTISRKEEKNFSIVYYLKDSEIISEKGSYSGGQILIYQKTDDYSIGDTIEVTGACELFAQARNEGNFDEREYYYSKGVFFSVKADSVALRKRRRVLWKEGLYQLRKQIRQVYTDMLPEKEAGILSVMTLGDKGMLDAEVKKIYQQSGISHVLAISGLHISILGMGIYRFLRGRRLSYLSSGVTAGIITFLFGQLSGMELSTKRAVLMFLVMLFGNILGMAYDSVTALSFSALLQLMENPYVLTYAGFLFSYSAVLAAVVAVKILKEAVRPDVVSGTKKTEKAAELTGVRGFFLRRFASGRKRIAETFFVSGCIQLATLPLTVWFYYEFPLYSVLINGLLLPFMGIILVSGLLGGLAGCAAGTLAGIGGAVGTMFRFIAGALGRLSWILLQPSYLLLRWNERICSLFGRLPGAVCVTGRPGMGMMIGYYVVLMGGLVLIHRWNRSGRLSAERKRLVPGAGSSRFKMYGTFVTVLLSLVFLLTVHPGRGFQICFLDVGQGDGIYVQAENGTAFFIDGGSTSEKKVGEYRMLSFLKYHGAGSVEGWFVSHADEDHISGLLEVWESGYRVKRLFLSQWIVQDEAWEKLCTLAEQYQTKITYLGRGDTVSSGELHFTCLYPGEAGTDRNGNSMALLLEQPGLSALFGGDLSSKEEKMLVREYPECQVDIYKANHHGSNGSNSEGFLKVIKPSVTVVSCGLENNYGHPGKEAVKRIMEAGTAIFYTMESGQITIECDRRGIRVKEYR